MTGAGNGRAHPGRFAVDWRCRSSWPGAADAEGRTTRYDVDVVAGWLGCGASLLAVAGGVVVATYADVPESGTVAGHLSLTLADSTGNDDPRARGRALRLLRTRAPRACAAGLVTGCGGSGDRFARVHRRAPVGVAPPGGPGLLGLRSSLRQASASHCSNRCGDQPRSWTSRM
jgi:hypothetical protein